MSYTAGVWFVVSDSPQAVAAVAVYDSTVPSGWRIFAEFDSKEDAQLFVASKELLAQVEWAAGMLQPLFGDTREVECLKAVIAKAKISPLNFKDQS